MDRKACTEPQCLYSKAIPLLPLWNVRPVQSLSACTRVHFALPLNTRSIFQMWRQLLIHSKLKWQTAGIKPFQFEIILFHGFKWLKWVKISEQLNKPSTQPQISVLGPFNWVIDWCRPNGGWYEHFIQPLEFVNLCQMKIYQNVLQGEKRCLGSDWAEQDERHSTDYLLPCTTFRSTDWPVAMQSYTCGTLRLVLNASLQKYLIGL